MAGMWYENAIFYGVDVRRFQDSDGDGFGDLRGLISRLDYLADLGVDALWLLPFFDTPLRDNGYDIQDYLRVDPRVGDLDDFNDLVQEAKKRNIRLVIDLVMNHTSDQHPWFQASRRDPASRYRDYYSWTEKPPEQPAGGGPIFPGEEDSVWTYDPLAKAYYFHRFYHFQPGLKIANPEVREEIYRTVDFWLSFDIDGFRFDAAPLMLQAKGLKDAKPDHPDEIFKGLHRYITGRKPQALLLGEANVSLKETSELFGGDSELNMLLNFMFGPHVFLALARGNTEPLRDYFQGIFIPPKKDAWLNFLRNLDELSLEKMSVEQRNVIFEEYAPQETMRIYGRGIRRRLAPMLSENGQGIDRRKIELVYSLLFSAPGAPLFTYGDEIGMGDALSLPGREAVRTPMQWSKEKNAGFSTADRLIAPLISEGPFAFEKVNVSDQQAETGSLLQFFKNLIAVRKNCLEIGICPIHVLEFDGNGREVLVTGYPSIEGNENIISLFLFHSLAKQPESVTIHPQKTMGASYNALLGNGSISQGDPEKLSVELPAYGYLWVRARDAR
jgi:maltose alpha-D-glucosyltransferase/alpha-amylase